MTDLPERLEAASEGSRELDAEIGERLAPDVVLDNGDWPHYTTNLQDAVSLVPEGWYPGIDPYFYEGDADGKSWFVRYEAVLCRPNWERWAPIHDAWIDRIRVKAKTPALALCAAIIRARTHDAT